MDDPVTNGDFGKHVVNVVDIDSDGLNDWLVSAPGTDNEKVYLLNEQSPSVNQGCGIGTPNEEMILGCRCFPWAMLMGTVLLK